MRSAIVPRKGPARVPAFVAAVFTLLANVGAGADDPQARTRSETKALPLAADDLLFVACSDVEIRGGDGPEVRAVIEKTVLGAEGDDPADVFDGIELVVRRASGGELFGFYKEAAHRPGLEHEFERFPFKPFLDREFTFITVKGLTHQEGNRQIELDLRNERGEGSVRSAWRRHAKLVLTVPKCRGVGVRGALGGFRVRSLEGPLMVEGDGDRDYHARFEVADLGGPLTASGIPIHRIDGVAGDVSILATAYAEDVGTSHGPDGVAMRPVPPKESAYEDVRGDLRVRACRVDLTLEGMAGRVDVENDFGTTRWNADRPLAPRDHRIVSQSGTIEVHLSSVALGSLRLALFTECGAVRLPRGDDGLQSKMFTSGIDDVARRSWHGFVTGRPDDPDATFSLLTRLPAALMGKPRSPGVDILSRAGTITYESRGDAPPGR